MEERADAIESPARESPARVVGRLQPDARPLYVRAQDALVDLIRDQGLQPGDSLPSETEIGRMLGVSRSTVREALRHLELNGTVRRIQGRGTLLATPPDQVVAGLETLESLHSLARRQGWACATTNRAVTTATLSPVHADALRREPASAATLVTRVKTRDGDPIAYMESRVPRDLMGLAEIEAGFGDSVLEMFERRGSPRLAYARATVHVSSAARRITGVLGLTSRSQLLLLCEVYHDPDDDPFCLSHHWFVPGSVKLEVVRRPR